MAEYLILRFFNFIRLYSFSLTCHNTKPPTPEESGFLMNALSSVSVHRVYSRQTAQIDLCMPYQYFWKLYFILNSAFFSSLSPLK